VIQALKEPLEQQAQMVVMVLLELLVLQALLGTKALQDKKVK
jgi:hypothetical protein